MKAKTVNAEIEKALIKKGYKWNKIEIKSHLGYTSKYEVKLDGRLVEVWDCKKQAFYD